MRLLKRYSWYRLPVLLAVLAVLTLFIIACGEDSTPAPTQRPAPAATQPPAPAATAMPTPTTAPPVTAAPAPAATQRPVPTATARPRPTATPAPTVSVAKEPVESRLIVAIPTPSYQVTMHHVTNQTDFGIMPIYDFLIGHDPKTNELLPQLATEWLMAPDGKTFTWTLREGVPFYRKGKPTDMMFTAKDVLHSFGIMAGVESELTRVYRPEFGGKVDADIVNDRTLVSRFALISLDMPFLLSDEWPVGMVSKEWWDLNGEEGYFEDPIGNGPWTFVEFEVGQHVLHERVENHWRKTPDFPEAQFLFAKEDATRLAMLLAGEAHIASIPRALHGQAESKGMVIAKSTLPAVHTHLRYSFFRPNSYVDPETGKPPFETAVTGPTPGYDINDPMRNVKVRQALNYAINYEEINDVFFQGEGFPLVDYFPPWRDDFKDEWAPIPGPDGKTGREGGWPYPYDPALAKEILTEAGYPDGFETTLVAALGQSVILEQGDVGETIKGYWEDIGVKTNLIAVGVGDVLAMWRARARANTSYLVSESLDPPCVAMGYSIHENGKSMWEHQEISDYRKACTSTTDVDERKRLAQEFGDWFVNNHIAAPIIWLFAFAAVNPNVVQEYEVNMVHMGPVRYHEFTKAVYK